MNHSRTIGALLLTAGFLFGSYQVVAHVTRVDWVPYGLAAGLMIAGMVLVRIGRRATADDHARHAADLDVLAASLDRLAANVAEFARTEVDLDLVRIHARIDAELMADLDSFVSARESMIPRFGMQRYADVMSPFATGERLINRAWSASADGYVDEVRACLTDAAGEFARARAQLAEARAAAA